MEGGWATRDWALFELEEEGKGRRGKVNVEGTRGAGSAPSKKGERASGFVSPFLLGSISQPTHTQQHHQRKPASGPVPFIQPRAYATSTPGSLHPFIPSSNTHSTFSPPVEAHFPVEPRNGRSLGALTKRSSHQITPTRVSFSCVTARSTQLSPAQRRAPPPQTASHPACN